MVPLVRGRLDAHPVVVLKAADVVGGPHVPPDGSHQTLIRKHGGALVRRRVLGSGEQGVREPGLQMRIHQMQHKDEDQKSVASGAVQTDDLHQIGVYERSQLHEQRSDVDTRVGRRLV